MVIEMDDSGAITPGGRFARMEAALERIEHKLDLKADQVSLDNIEARVIAIETVGTPKLQGVAASLDVLRSHVTDLEVGRVQSPQTQDTMRVFQQHTTDIATLQRDALVKDTQIKTAKETQDKISDARFAQIKTYVTIISIVSGIAIILSSSVTILSLLGIIK